MLSLIATSLLALAPLPHEIEECFHRIESGYRQRLREAGDRESQQAAGLWRNGSYRELLERFSGAVPASERELFFLARACEESGAHGRALELAEALVLRVPGWSEAHGIRIRGWLRRGDTTRAAEVLREARRSTGSASSLTPYWCALGALHVQRGEAAGAIDCLETYLRLRIPLAQRTLGETAGLDLALGLWDRQLLELGERARRSWVLDELVEAAARKLGDGPEPPGASLMRDALALELATGGEGEGVHEILERSLKRALRLGSTLAEPGLSPPERDRTLAVLAHWRERTLASASLWDPGRVLSLLRSIGEAELASESALTLHAQIENRLRTRSLLPEEAAHLGAQLERTPSARLFAILPADARATFAEAYADYERYLEGALDLRIAPATEAPRLHLFGPGGEHVASTLGCGPMELSRLAWSSR